MRKSKTTKPIIYCALFLFANLQLLPWLMCLPPFRAVFEEWTVLAIEIIMFVLLFVVFFARFMLGTKHRDNKKFINYS